MSNHPFSDDSLRVPVLGGALLIALVLLATTTASISGVGVTRSQPIVAADSRDLLVTDGPDGTLVITDINHPSKPYVFRASNGEGFVSVAIQGLNFARAAAGIDQSSPFRLLRDTSGRFSLEDLATHKRLTLDAFGPGNARVFAQFFSDGKVQQ